MVSCPCYWCNGVLAMSPLFPVHLQITHLGVTTLECVVFSIALNVFASPEYIWWSVLFKMEVISLFLLLNRMMLPYSHMNVLT